jgi:hypothetical protein
MPHLQQPISGTYYIGQTAAIFKVKAAWRRESRLCMSLFAAKNSLLGREKFPARDWSKIPLSAGLFGSICRSGR